MRIQSDHTNKFPLSWSLHPSGEELLSKDHFSSINCSEENTEGNEIGNDGKGLQRNLSWGVNKCIHVFEGCFGFCLGNVLGRDKNRSRETLLSGGYLSRPWEEVMVAWTKVVGMWVRGRWRDELAETGKSGIKVNRTKGNQMGIYSRMITWRSFWSNPLFSTDEEITSQ